MFWIGIFVGALIGFIIAALLGAAHRNIEDRKLVED